MEGQVFTNEETKRIIESVTKRVQITDVLMSFICYETGVLQMFEERMQTCKDMPEVAAAIEAVRTFKRDHCIFG